MADNYARQGQTFRAKDNSGILSPIVAAGEHVRIFDGIQSIASSGSSQALTPASGSTHALIYCEGAADTDFVRYWQDGTAPSATVGKKLKDHEEMACAAPASFHFITGSGSGACTLRMEYYHYA